MRFINFFFLIFLIGIISSCNKNKKTNEAAAKMQQFVVDISTYAKAIDTGFFIVPQNGAELVYNQADEQQGINQNYLNAVDAFGNEEIFYNGKLSVDDYRLNILRNLKSQKPIFVSESVTDDNNITDAITRNKNEGFIPFIRDVNDYYYEHIPTYITDEDTNNIAALSEVKNYLYLISNSGFSDKQTMLAAIENTNYDMIIMDLFFDDAPFSASEIEQLKTKANGKKRIVIAYMNIGSAENYRYYWQSDWKVNHPDWLKKKYAGYPDEVWVEFWNSEWQKIIFGNNDSYLKKIIDTGFDGVYLDNVEAYYFLYHKN